MGSGEVVRSVQCVAQENKSFPDKKVRGFEEVGFTPSSAIVINPGCSTDY